ncbi:YkvI family membrane protein [Anoxynatronum buryatiense]|uniref:Uncharacterized membrane protein YkvI n=1 Tax=Anoxynatronum buryatiense TaxID=489973 RepID=A0AA45WU92_9CLOT|nr:hypothetical protein [Anoxynatronum buryatiense]SMP45661.1 Uncharacterized membrane protein YkvI [Anoxynatronum buryatiense]
MPEKAHWKEIILFGGAIMGSVVGAGFASGQEVMQFFTHLGFIGSIGAGLVGMLLLAWISMTILEDGRTQQFEDANDIFAYYCGQRIGFFFEWFVPTLMLLAFSIMISAAAATIHEHFGLHPALGRFVMALLPLITVLTGLKRLARIVGSIAPFFISVTMIISLTSIVRHPGGIVDSAHVLQGLHVPGAYSHWLVSGIMYASFLMVGFMPFAAGIGKQAKNRTDTRLGGLFAGIFFLAGAMILSTGLLVIIGDVYNKQIPSLAMASASIPPIAPFFALLMLTGIYTASTSMLWTAVNRIEGNDQTLKYRFTALLLTILAFFGGHLQFATMVGIVYPAVGYLGLVLIAGMLYRRFFSAVGGTKTNFTS